MSYDVGSEISGLAPGKPARWLFLSDGICLGNGVHDHFHYFGVGCVFPHANGEFSGLIISSPERLPIWMADLAFTFFDRDGAEANVFEFSRVWKNFRRLTRDEIERRANL